MSDQQHYPLTTTKEALYSLSPLDGRYVESTMALRDFFSEFAFIKARVWVELQYLMHLSERTPLLREKGLAFDSGHMSHLMCFLDQFGQEEAMIIKEIEKTTRHEMKAVEYYLKLPETLPFLTKEQTNWIHWALTSQDVNSLVYVKNTREALEEVIVPEIQTVLNKLYSLGEEHLKIPMLSRTHGQPASPTTLGKELYVFAERLQNSLADLEAHVWTAKFGGAVGNFNAHHIAAPQVDWPKFADHFLKIMLDLDRVKFTTQIDHYDNLAKVFDNLKRINVILVDLCRDIWLYISQDYFKQKIVSGEVGSSTMPHKVNPIDFENAEGNFLMANAMLMFLSQKLPISRLQRDLSDSTVIRNVGVALGHMLLALKGLNRGLNKLQVNEQKILADFDHHWSVVGEAYQTILKREGVTDGYERLKEFTRVNSSLGQAEMHEFVADLPVSDEVKEELRRITPQNYLGILPK